MSWAEIEQACRKVAQKIRESNYRPDIVVALSRGGLVPARLLCDLLIIKDLVSIKVNHWGITATKDNKAEITYASTFNLSGKNVLIVDDITDSGESMYLSVNFVKENMRPATIKTATIYHISHSKITPDFYAEEMPATEWAWVVWPWNFVEDMKNILEKELGGTLNFNDSVIKSFVADFNKKYQANLTMEMLEDALKVLNQVDGVYK